MIMSGLTKRAFSAVRIGFFLFSILGAISLTHPAKIFAEACPDSCEEVWGTTCRYEGEVFCDATLVNCDSGTDITRNNHTEEQQLANECQQKGGCVEVQIRSYMGDAGDTRNVTCYTGAESNGSSLTCPEDTLLNPSLCKNPNTPCRDTSGNCVSQIINLGSAETIPFQLCQQVPPGQEREDCCTCVSGTSSCVVDNPDYAQYHHNLWTAVGCIPTDGTGIVTSILRIGMSIAGGIVLLMILASAFQLTVSQGDPKKVEEARGMITSAVGGLLFIIFSMIVLETIGVSILQIPGF